jgi:two-component system response regulator YesN
MYKVLFVDDEPWVIIDILHSIPWRKLGFEVISHYEKAAEACEAVLSKKPDLVFVDIQMPVMNGFEFINHCQKKGSKANFIILSAHSDFHLAQKAIRASVLDYCLKPVNPPVLIRTLEDIRTRLDQAWLTETKIPVKPESTDKPVNIPPNEQRFKNILDFIKANFREKISLRQLSEKFYFNDHYICDLFRRFTNTTFANYLTGIRIEEAKKLLETTYLPLRVIAEELCFSDTAYFSRTFKRFCGMAPSEYRRRNSFGGDISG